MTMRSLSTSILLAFAAIAPLAIVGCGPRVETYEMPTKTALDETREILQGYAAGNQPSSEMENFPGMIERLRTEGGPTADVAIAALEKIRANPASAKATATQALKDLDAAAPAPAPAAS